MQPDPGSGTDQEDPPSDDGVPTVLVVDDEPDLLALYADWLSGPYDVRTAAKGSDVVPLENPVDVVILDRRMPSKSGDEVLQDLRANGFDGQVGMVTAVEPEIDIAEMAFDDYLCKPVTERELRALVERLLKRAELDEKLKEWYTINVKIKRLLEANRELELERNEEYRDLIAARAEAKTDVIDLLEHHPIVDPEMTLAAPIETPRRPDEPSPHR